MQSSTAGGWLQAAGGPLAASGNGEQLQTQKTAAAGRTPAVGGQRAQRLVEAAQRLDRLARVKLSLRGVVVTWGQLEGERC